VPKPAALFDYEFTTWPEAHEGEHSVFDVFRLITPRTSLTLTEHGFWELLCQLRGSGLTALEVTKVPHREDEIGSTRGAHRAA
jgi:hypothetical protein